MQRMVVLQCSRWNFKDEDSGRQVQGAKLIVLDGSSVEDNEDKKGAEVLELRCGSSLFDYLRDGLKNGPAVFELETVIKPKGKVATVHVVQAHFLKVLDLLEVIRNAGPSATPGLPAPVVNNGARQPANA